MSDSNKEKQLIRATLAFAQEDRAKSWWYTLSTFALIILAYVVIFVADFLWLKLVSSILLGLTLVRFFVIYHDYAHNSILQKSLPAKWLFTFFGLFILAPLSIWRRSHDHHHHHNSKLYTSSIGSYPIVKISGVLFFRVIVPFYHRNDGYTNSRCKVNKGSHRFYSPKKTIGLSNNFQGY